MAMRDVHCEVEEVGATPRGRDHGLVWLLGRAALRSHQSLQERFVRHGIRKWHYAVLAAVDEAGPVTQADISRRLSLDGSDLVGVLNDLVSAGYVTRNPDPANRRRNLVALTEEGAAALREFDVCVVETEDELLATLAPDERKQLVSLLARVLDAARPAGVE